MIHLRRKESRKRKYVAIADAIVRAGGAPRGEETNEALVRLFTRRLTAPPSNAGNVTTATPFSLPFMLTINVLSHPTSSPDLHLKRIYRKGKTNHVNRT